MQSYKLHYRRPGQWVWRKLVLKGQQFLPDHNKLICHLVDGSYYELPDLSRCEIRYTDAMIACLRKGTPNDHASGAQEPDRV